MTLRRFETPGIAHFAYLLGDGGEAAIVDPRRDVDVYLAAAQQEGLRITYVIETHRQEDFVMGAANLAARAGAKIVNGRHELFGHGDLRLDDGETLSIGAVTLRALHTPGHTPESMSYAVFPAEHGRRAWGVFTGDALFFGDTGRTDLTDSSRARENAALLYDSVHRKLAPLGDGTLVLPAHGAGSVCGSGMAPRPLSTIGAERAYNAVFTLGREAFARKKGEERLPRPPYFRLMEEVNLRGGLPPARRPEDVPLVGPEALADRRDGELVLDARSPEAFAGAHIPGSLAVWMDGLPIFGGWVARRDTPLWLVLDRDADLEEASLHLSRIGMDGVKGALAGGFSSWFVGGRPIERSGVISPRQLSSELDGAQVLDVRDADEVRAGRIPGARHAYVGHLEERLDELQLDRERPVTVTCSVGNRAGLGVSILLRHGFEDVRNLLGGMKAWNALGLPTRKTSSPRQERAHGIATT